MITLDIGQIVVWLIIGGLAGAIAGRILRGRRGFGLVGNIVIGLIGALIGGVLFDIFGISISATQFSFTLDDLIAAIIGSLILLVVLFAVRR